MRVVSRQNRKCQSWEEASWDLRDWYDADEEKPTELHTSQPQYYLNVGTDSAVNETQNVEQIQQQVTTAVFDPAPLKLRPYGAIQICLLLLLLSIGGDWGEYSHQK